MSFLFHKELFLPLPTVRFGILKNLQEVDLFNPQKVEIRNEEAGGGF